MENKKNENTEIQNNNAELIENSIEIGASAAGAVIGLIFGGPLGAVAGSVLGPTVTLTQTIIKGVRLRRQKRLENVLENAVKHSNISIEDALKNISDDPQKSDTFISLLSLAANSDEALDSIFIGLISELINCPNSTQMDRIVIIADAVRNLRSIHLKIILAIHNAGGTLSATEIAEAVGIPEIELRSVVRDLELRGMLLDLEKEPTCWMLRELGNAIVIFIQNKMGGES